MIVNGTSAPQLDGVTWRKSTFSQGNSNCAEIGAVGPGQVAIRQNTHPTGPVLAIARDEFAAWVADVKAGGLDHLLI